MPHSAQKLPADLLERVVYSTSGGEYAWRVEDIPSVIEAARQASLLNLDGTLQFRLADGGICECYWVDVDPGEPPTGMDWQGKVEWTADKCLERFEELKGRIDFVRAGRDDFGGVLKELSEAGTDIAQLMCFVWNVCDREEYAALERTSRAFGSRAVR